MSFLLDPQVWLDLLILTILEIVLGIDNIVFIVLVSNRLPEVRRQVLARRIGLLLAMLMRLILLGVIFWLAHLTAPLFSIGSLDFSIRDLVEIIGGGFLVYKAIHELMEHSRAQNDTSSSAKVALFWVVIIQIMIFDLIFSLDSVITAVAIAEYYTIMATAIIIAVIVMIVASEPVNYFIKKYVRVKLLALLLILLVGVMLMLHGFSIAFSEGYLYLAMALLAVVMLPPWKRWLCYR